MSFIFSAAFTEPQVTTAPVFSPTAATFAWSVPSQPVSTPLGSNTISWASAPTSLSSSPPHGPSPHTPSPTHHHSLVNVAGSTYTATAWHHNTSPDLILGNSTQTYHQNYQPTEYIPLMQEQTTYHSPETLGHHAVSSPQRSSPSIYPHENHHVVEKVEPPMSEGYREDGGSPSSRQDCWSPLDQSHTSI